MVDETRIPVERSLRLLEGRMTRANLLRAAGVGIAAAALPGVASAADISYPYYPQVPGTYSPESLSDIARTLHTAAHLGAGIMYAGLTSESLNLAADPLQHNIVLGALVQHQRHAEFLDGIGNPNGLKGSAWFVNDNGVSGGVSPASSPPTLTLPDGILDSADAFFSAMEWRETLYVGMYIAAIRETAEVAQEPEFAKWLAQILGVEGGLRVLARTALGNMPPNDKAYETDYLLYVRDAVPALVAKGYFNGSGPALPVFSPAAAKTPAFLNVAGSATTDVVQQTPNNATTSDADAVPGARS